MTTNCIILEAIEKDRFAAQDVAIERMRSRMVRELELDLAYGLSLKGSPRWMQRKDRSSQSTRTFGDR